MPVVADDLRLTRDHGNAVAAAGHSRRLAMRVRPPSWRGRRFVFALEDDVSGLSGVHCERLAATHEAQRGEDFDKSQTVRFRASLSTYL